MRVVLVHNEAAGDAMSVARMARTIAGGGHEVVAVTHPSADLRALVPLGVDLYAVAGGDGTVAAAAFALADAGLTTPMAVLPMGTANNTARSLGVASDPDVAVAAWSGSTVRPLDLGRATGPWGERRFLESVGGGLVTHGIVVMDRRDYTSPTTAAQLTRARHAFADVLAVMEPVGSAITIDDQPIAAPWLLVEVLNVGSVGPNLRLADASPCDGGLTVVAAGADGRAALIEALRTPAADATAPAGLQVWTAREVVIAASDRLHVDDTVVDAVEAGTVRVGIEPGAVAVLVP